MKRFIRTIAGKTMLFIICIISLCMLMGSVVGAIIFAEGNFYTRSEKAIYDDTIHRMLISKSEDIIQQELYEGSYNNDNSNIIYEMLDENGKILRATEDGVTANKQDWDYSVQYDIEKDGDEVTNIYFYHDSEMTDRKFVNYTLHISLKDGLPENDEFSFVAKCLNIGYRLRYMVYVIGILALLTAIVSFTTLMCIAGHKPGSEKIYSGPLNRIPFDLLVAACIFAEIMLMGLCCALGPNSVVLFVIILSICCLVGLTIFLGLCMSTATRTKQKTLLKNTVIYYGMKLVWRIVKKSRESIKKINHKLGCFILQIPLIWRTLVVVLGISLLEYIVIELSWWELDNFFVFWILEKLILIPVVLYVAIMLRKLQKAGAALANGNLSYHLDTKGLWGDFKYSGEDLNHIASGMSLAVEERLKSERMKTELITNVSHDIKTPLTSIINYATLIGNESCENEKIIEYSTVLVRQSERLKRLIEDLVEASKASTGNLDVLLSPCDPSIFLTQAGGEYEEKLQRAELTLVIKQPEQEVQIMADGRRMWRVFDNLMNNICKYAQSGTRVYLTLEIIGKNAVITFKNTSRDPLDISEAELMERFVRGDTSRNTEGNGLGLSIAKSMVELQNGSLHLLIDGDLFKVALSFPIIS